MLTHLLVRLAVNVCDLAIFWIFELLFTNLQCYKQTIMLQTHKLTMLQTYNVTNLQFYKLTMLQTNNVTNLQCYKLTNSQTYLQTYKLKLNNVLSDIVNLLLDLVATVGNLKLYLLAKNLNDLGQLLASSLTH